MVNEAALSRLHYELVHGLLETGVCPSNEALQRRLDVPEHELHERMMELASIHGVVLHPHANRPWILHPFSLTPTLNWVQGDRHSWWAPCIWCALGVAVLAGGHTRVHTRWGAESEPLIIPVKEGGPEFEGEVLVHFAIPPARAWDNVHEHCALVLPFRSRESIESWCRRYGVAMGEVLPLEQVSRLARTWYGSHAHPHWRKWNVAEAQEIFRECGLTSEFWSLTQREGAF